MDDNWIVENLENALATWNEKLAEIWQLVSMTPQEFKGGGIWNIVVQINGALQAIGYGLLVLFFAMGLFKNTVNFRSCAARRRLCGISCILWRQKPPSPTVCR